MRPSASRIAVLLAALALVAAPASTAGSPDGLVLDVSPLVSPNGDGRLDRAAVDLVLAAPALATVTIRDAAGAEVAVLAREVAFPAGETELVWDGSDASSRRVSDGEYAVLVQAVDAAGVLVERAAAVRVDTRPPRLLRAHLPAETGAGPLTASVRTAGEDGSIAVDLLVSSAAGSVWRSGSDEVSAGPALARLRLADAHGRRLAPGGYPVALRLRDEAGNEARSSWRRLLVRYAVRARVVYRVDGAGPLVALTFDDCNEGPAWTSILATLGTRRVHAAFFCLAGEVAEHPAQAWRTVRAGHVIGAHGTGHRPLPSLATGPARAEVRGGADAWWRATGTAPMPWYRPAYGALDPGARRAIGAEGFGRIVLWDVDPRDWSDPGASVIAARVLAQARRGSIVLLHVEAQTARALPSILTGLAARGLRPVGLDRLLAAGRPRLSPSLR